MMSNTMNGIQQTCFQRGSRTYFLTCRLSEDGNTVRYGATIHNATEEDELDSDMMDSHFNTSYNRYERFPVKTNTNERLSQMYRSLRTRGSYERFFNSKKFQNEMIKLFCQFSVRQRGETITSLREKEFKYKYLRALKDVNRTTSMEEEASGVSKKGRLALRSSIENVLNGSYMSPHTRRTKEEFLDRLIDPRSRMASHVMEMLGKQPIHFAIIDDPERWMVDDIGEYNGARMVHIAYKRLPSGYMLYGATIFHPKSRSDIHRYDQVAHFETALTRLENYPVQAYLPTKYTYHTRQTTSGCVQETDTAAWKDFRKCIGKYGVRCRGSEHRFIRSHEIQTWACQDRKDIGRQLADLQESWGSWSNVRSIKCDRQ